MESNKTLLSAQQGLLMRPIFGQIWDVRGPDANPDIYDLVVEIAQRLSQDIATKYPKCGLIVGFNPSFLNEYTGQDIKIQSKVLDQGIKFSRKQGSALIYAKGPDQNELQKLLQPARRLLEKNKCKLVIVEAGRRPDCRIVGGRYLDSISNPNDPVSLTEDILIGDPGKRQGGCFAFTQKFSFDWKAIASMTSDAQDEMIGRNSDSVVLSQHAKLGHIHRAHIYDKNRDQRKMLRQALPFGTSNGHVGREEGLMFVAFCNEQDRFEKILQNLLGDVSGEPIDRMMDVVEGQGGGYWYIPPASELGVTAVSSIDNVYEDPHWKASSPNGFLFYNSQDYLHQMAEGRYVGGDAPTPRLLSLLSRTFNHWRDGWLHRQRFPRLPHLSTVSRFRDVMKQSVAVRKGLAIKYTLDELSSLDSRIARDSGLLRIESRELIVGIIPDFTLGRGKEVVPYLSKDETMAAWTKGQLNEWSAMGHVVPNYEVLVTRGLKALRADLEKLMKDNISHKNSKKYDFYYSADLSLEGMQQYLENWAKIAARRSGDDPTDPENVREVVKRLMRLRDEPAQSFQDAVQLIYSYHCCLHLVGDLTSLGRLDQILWPFLQNDKSVKPERAQEIIDCLFAKIGENAFVDRASIYDYVNYGTTSVCGVGGNFPQGGGINQWVQQITVGGFKSNDNETAEGGANPVTMLFLKAARRIPVNAPTLSLRVYKDMPSIYLDEAAKSILSGGAQPILYNDSKLCEALFRSGETVTRAWSRNYAADGCYEPMLAGASEFAFNNVVLLAALEQTINQGATYGAAGPESLRGLKMTFRSPPASEIKTFEQLQRIFVEQLEWLVVSCYNLMLTNYGNLAEICPSPLLSTLIDGCIEKGRDLSNGGAKFHIIAPLCVGMTNTIDSLFAIKKLVYDPQTAVTTLPALVNCLINDWGFNMIEPYQDHQIMSNADSVERGLHYQELRLTALSLPKWGSGDEEVNTLGEWLMEETVRLCVDVIRKPSPALATSLDTIRKNYGEDFEFVVEPGIGTFEGYLGDGLPSGASADGRRNSMPIASDMSPVPAPQDLPPVPAFRNIYQAMEGCKNDAAEFGLSNASPVDMNIEETFPLPDLQRFIRKYADGEVGGNLITLTCADLKTYQAASKDPEKYNLVRVRMGGWTEFYATMFPGHQDQHQRRQYFVHGQTES